MGRGRVSVAVEMQADIGIPFPDDPQVIYPLQEKGRVLIYREGKDLVFSIRFPDVQQVLRSVRLVGLKKSLKEINEKPKGVGNGGGRVHRRTLR